MISIIDYGVGNLFSLKSSVSAVGREAFVSSDPDELLKADGVILPGVGAFADAAAKLRESGLDRTVADAARQGKPVLGICLGMQLLFGESLEFGRHKGLGLIPGVVVPIKGVSPRELKIPQIGWNSLEYSKNGRKLAPSPLFSGISQGEYVYFVHSYYADCPDEYISAVTEYGAELTAAVAKGNIFGCQFHPEKSGRTGLKILENFCVLSEAAAGNDPGTGGIIC